MHFHVISQFEILSIKRDIYVFHQKQIYVLRMLDTDVNLYLSGTSSITLDLSSYVLKAVLHSILIRSNPRNNVQFYHYNRTELQTMHSGDSLPS